MLPPPSRRRCLGLTAGWALLGSAACGFTFIISLIPGPAAYGRSLPPGLWFTELAIAVVMLPLCALIPLPLLISGHAYLCAAAGAGTRWPAIWTATASASVAVEVLFWIRLVHLLEPGFPSLPDPSWHALAFSVGFLAVGGAMSWVLIRATRPAPSAAGIA